MTRDGVRAVQELLEATFIALPHMHPAEVKRLKAASAAVRAALSQPEEPRSETASDGPPCPASRKPGDCPACDCADLECKPAHNSRHTCAPAPQPEEEPGELERVRKQLRTTLSEAGMLRAAAFQEAIDAVMSLYIPPGTDTWDAREMFHAALRARAAETKRGPG